MPGEAKARVELLQGTVDLIVLQVLSTMGPQHAYGIAARVEQVAEDLLSLGTGNAAKPVAKSRSGVHRLGRQSHLLQQRHVAGVALQVFQ